MNVKEIQDIINFIKKTDLYDVSIETENYKIRVKNNPSSITEKIVHQSTKPKIIEKKETIVEKSTTEPITTEEKTGNNNIIIRSPMIGTFYKSPNPESDPFVSEGDSIKVGQTICIIEAMKLFNEIESEFTGKVVKVLANDSSPVEFDQPLFEIDPS
ncbi:MAG: acetyl-CoA carboxylase biotin carboxyl carrier protein [Flammeovirgaceae bacterium TMED290]|nr:MAG: acetyl-CoA carboxylase biotin carboxyl carrier protein [Flammeovirgaceae bacterium TMED290]|tara:strand:+ start:16163 stop:16633 length:471 start_codon:yes stop_codon:yes gene_type:complete